MAFFDLEVFWGVKLMEGGQTFGRMSTLALFPI